MIQITDVSKTFTLHTLGAAVIDVLANASLEVRCGECVALTGASGTGKSTLMRMTYGNYLTVSGSIMIDGVDVAKEAPREILALRREPRGCFAADRGGFDARGCDYRDIS